MRKSRPYEIPLSSNPNILYIFEIIIYNNDKLIICLSDLEDKEKYERSYTFEELKKEFSVLPKTVKYDLIDLMHFQVFIAGLAKNKKIKINKNKNEVSIELKDIAPAPKGAEYNVSILLEEL